MQVERILEKTMQRAMNKKGFSSILLLVLGSIFFLIVASMGIYMDGENNSQVDLARSTTSESKLVFIAQAMQADFYNNLLQSGFEGDIIDFLIESVHILDPDKSFEENLGDQLEQHMSESATGIVSGDAGHVYSTAYSEVPRIGCTPAEVEGASASVTLDEKENGALEVSSWSLGQRIKCEDTEAESEMTIDLQARDYQLQTRAVALHDRAVEEIRGIRDLLDNTYGTLKISSGWRLPNDNSVRPLLLNGPMGWLNSISGVIGLRPSTNVDGIVTSPTDFNVVRNTNGAPYRPEDLSFSCYGDLDNAPMASQNGGQTCRPDDLSLYLKGEEPEEGEEGEDEIEGGEEDTEESTEEDDTADETTEQEFTVPEDAIELGFDTTSSTGGTFEKSYGGGAITVNVEIPGLGKILESILDSVVSSGLDKGYLTYGGVTHLCNRFRGKASTAVIRGQVTETNAEYIPNNLAETIPFRFMSTSQGMDSSQLKNEENCQGEDKAIKENIRYLLTDEQGNLRIRIEKGEGDSGPVVNEEDLEQIGNNINQNDLYNVPGENKVVDLEATVEGGEAVTVEGTPNRQAQSETAAGLEGLNTGDVVVTSSGEKDPLSKAFTSGSFGTSSVNLIQGLQEASSALNFEGMSEDAEALSRTASSICKMMGVSNYANAGDYGKALMALCGLGRLQDVDEADNICNVAGLYQAVQSGSVQAVVSALNNMAGNMGYPDDLIKAATIAAAVQSGDIRAVLEAAATAARLAGDEDLMRFYAGVSSLINGLETGDYLNSAAGLFRLMGEEDMANFLGSTAGLMEALENQDAEAGMRYLSQMASSLGYSQMASIGSQMAAVQGVMDALANMDDLMAKCKDAEWDILCLMPSSGGNHLVCEQNYPYDKSCTLSSSWPSINPEALCDSIITDMGFKLDCTCVYACPKGGTMIDLQSVKVNINNIYMLLDNAQYAWLSKIAGIAGLAEALSQGDADLMSYCQLDP